MPSAWLLEDDETVATALQILHEQAEEAKKRKRR